MYIRIYASATQENCINVAIILVQGISDQNNHYHKQIRMYILNLNRTAELTQKCEGMHNNLTRHISFVKTS